MEDRLRVTGNRKSRGETPQLIELRRYLPSSGKMKGKPTNNLSRIAQINESFMHAGGYSTLGKYPVTTVNILERCLVYNQRIGK
ncbi:MAG: hypothetical protein OXN17_22480 [Candidatus Poribacteria bacterium]|nr:hypothetical protein [Candidatus Poribacteria bacterium]